MARRTQRSIAITAAEWHEVKVAARRAGILEGKDVSASEIIRRGTAREVKHVEKKWEARDG